MNSSGRKQRSFLLASQGVVLQCCPERLFTTRVFCMREFAKQVHGGEEPFGESMLIIISPLANFQIGLGQPR